MEWLRALDAKGLGPSPWAECRRWRCDPLLSMNKYEGVFRLNRSTNVVVRVP